MNRKLSAWPLAKVYLQVQSLILLGAVMFFSPGHTFSASIPRADTLNAKYTALKNDLNNNPFERPLSIDSVESSNHLKGDVYALIDHPFDVVSTALQVPSNWCDILILHLNTKYCKSEINYNNQMLNVYFGKKIEQSLQDAYEVELGYRVTHSDRHYLGVQLSADRGPMGTSNYHISLEAIPLGRNQSFIHLTYSYAYGLAGGLAIKAYLVSAGRDKVGFTQMGDSGNTSYIGGVRGMIERNTMRYYLAIDSYLESFSERPGKRLNKRLQHWFSATEQYPRQLNEISRSAYLSMKETELHRMK